MDLFAFINHADPTMVRIGEKQTKKGQVLLLESTRGRVVSLDGVNKKQENQNDDVQEVDAHVIQDDGVNIAADEEVEASATDKPKVQNKRRKPDGASGSDHPLKKLKEDHGTSGDVGANTGEKSIAVIQELFERSTLNVEVGIMVIDIVSFVTSSVTLLPEHSSHHSNPNVVDAEVTSIVRSSVPPPPVLTAAVATTAIGMDYEQLFMEFNVGVARHACFSVEVRLRSEHNYRERNKFERKCNRQADLLKEKDVEIANFKAQLSLKEAEAIEAIRLRSQVYAIKAAKTARVGKLNSLKTLDVDKGTLEGQLSCDELSVKTASLESQKDCLIDQVSSSKATSSGLRDQVLGYELFKEQYEAVQDEQVKILSIYHGKATRCLVDVAAYNLFAEANYVSIVNTLCSVDFPLLAQLESQKDASITDIMGLLHLEGLASETLEASQLQPSHEQLMLPIHRTEDQVVIGETSLSFSLDVVHAHVQRIKGDHVKFTDSFCTTTALLFTFVQASSVPPIPALDYEVIHGRRCPLRSICLYALLPSAFVTSYGPSHLGPSFLPSSAWLASLLRLQLVLFFLPKGLDRFLRLHYFALCLFLLSSSLAFIPSLKLLFALFTKPLV
nr:hypothetical protein [Tanacetum cinerariifolium]